MRVVNRNGNACRQARVHWLLATLVLNIKRCSRFCGIRRCLSVISETPTIEVVTRVTGQVQLCPAPASKSLVFQVDNTAQTDRISSSLFRELGYFTLGLDVLHSPRSARPASPFSPISCVGLFALEAIRSSSSVMNHVNPNGNKTNDQWKDSQVQSKNLK